MKFRIGEMPRDPVELAKVRAEQVRHDVFDHTEHDERVLAELDFAASELGFIGQNYFVDTNRVLILPASFDATQNVRYVDILGVSFEAKLATFARVSIGRLVGHQTVRALCLVFGTATLLPFLETTPDSDIVYTPVLAVNSIDAKG